MLMDFLLIPKMRDMKDLTTDKDFDNYFLALSTICAIRSTCIRRRYGIVIVKHQKAVGYGYNGNYDGCHRDCIKEGSCLRDDNGIADNEIFDPCLREEFSITEDDENFKDAAFYISSYDKRNNVFIPISLSTEWIYKLSKMGVKRIVVGIPENSNEHCMEHI